VELTLWPSVVNLVPYFNCFIRDNREHLREETLGHVGHEFTLQLVRLLRPPDILFQFQVLAPPSRSPSIAMGACQVSSTPMHPAS
jgi:hypothetical protein